MDGSAQKACLRRRPWSCLSFMLPSKEQGSWGFCQLLSLVIMITDLGTPPLHHLLNLWDDRYSALAQSLPPWPEPRKLRDVRQGESQWNTLSCSLISASARAQQVPWRVLLDGSVLLGREGQWERLGPGVRQTWPDANQLWDQGQVA